jgi:hypothetical protein
MAPPVSPNPSPGDLPVSAATMSPISFCRRPISVTMALRIRPRCTGGVSAQPGCAARAIATACSTSSVRERATFPSTDPSWGARFSNHSPLAAGCHSPPIRLGISAGIPLPMSMPSHHAVKPPSTTRLLPVM